MNNLTDEQIAKIKQVAEEQWTEVEKGLRARMKPELYCILPTVKSTYIMGYLCGSEDMYMALSGLVK